MGPLMVASTLAMYAESAETPRSGLAGPRGLTDEAADEGQGDVANLAPAAVDDERVPAVGDHDGLGDAGVAALLLVDGVGDGRRGCVVLLAGDDQHRPAVGVLAVGPGFGEGVEVGG